MPKSPEQFERLPAEQLGEEEEKLTPEKPAELKLSPEQDKELLGLIKKARQAENQGKNEEAIILLQDIKERLSKIKEEREGRERRKPEITEEDWKAMEDGLEAYREKGNWGLFFERAMYMKILDPARDFKITEENWKAMEDELERCRKVGDWGSFSYQAMAMKILDPERDLKITKEDWKGMEDELEELRERGEWRFFFSRAVDMKILDPEKDLKITKEDWKEWKAMEDELERLRKEGIMWVSFSILASNMKILASSKVEVPPEGGLKVE